MLLLKLLEIATLANHLSTMRVEARTSFVSYRSQRVGRRIVPRVTARRALFHRGLYRALSYRGPSLWVCSAAII